MSDDQRMLLTRADVAKATGDIRLPPGSLVTPSAQDLAEQKGISIISCDDTESAQDSGAAESVAKVNLTPAQPSEIAAVIDHTNLSPVATQAEIAALCAEANEYRFAAVCVAPLHVPFAVSELAGSGITVCGVAGFPTGAHATEFKAIEAARCVNDGAREIDMVAAHGYLCDEKYQAYFDGISAVRRAVGDGITLKVIIEASLLSDTDTVRAGIIAVEAGADFVKTSTGVYGTARVEDVVLLRRSLPPEIKIKAAGGIRTSDAACTLLAAGADRLGMSGSVAVMRELAPG
jgi:deoxyribose-phosphate aldolase